MTKDHYEPCPFCGSDKVYGKMEIIGIEGWQYFVINCPNCYAMVVFFNEDDKSVADVINRYNRRSQ